MKRSLNRRYHILIVVLMGLIMLQSLLLLISLGQLKGNRSQINDIQSIVIIFFFVIFVFGIVLYNYVPFRLRRAFGEIRALIDEISHGNYMIDIDSSMYDQDTDIQDLILAIQRMLHILMRFDQVKADKIYEHNQRIQQLINILQQQVIICNANGDIVYCNDSVRRMYPIISEMVNLNELIIKDRFDEEVFNTLSNALRYGNNLVDKVIQHPGDDRFALLNGCVIRNRKGVSTGAVFVMAIRDNETQD